MVVWGCENGAQRLKVMWSEVVRLMVNSCWSVGQKWHMVDRIVVRNEQIGVDGGLCGVHQPQVVTC